MWHNTPDENKQIQRDNLDPWWLKMDTSGYILDELFLTWWAGCSRTAAGTIGPGSETASRPLHRNSSPEKPANTIKGP